MKNKSTSEWIFLTNVGPAYEYEMIKSMLEELSIPVMKKNRGSGGYTDIAMGMSISGYDIYVPASKITEAREMLREVETNSFDALIENQNIEDGSSDINANNGYILSNHRQFKYVLIILFVIPGGLFLLYSLLQSLRSVFE